jgi:two-component system NtrC family sensor kinase
MKDGAAVRNPGKGKLALRLILVLVLGVTFIYLAMAFWSISSQRRNMTGMLETAAERCSSLIRNATREGMLEEGKASVQGIIDTIASSDGIRRVRIIDRNGFVKISTEGGEGEQLPLDSFQCQICHSMSPIPSELPGKHRMRVVDRGDESFLCVVEPIPNEPSCQTSGCHSADRRILGIIDLDLPLAPMEAHIRASETQLGVGFLLTVVAITLLTLYLLWQMVLNPVRRLADAADRVAGGDLTATVPVDSVDEIGRMSASWNTMVGEIAKNKTELERWSQTLEDRVKVQTLEVESAHQRMLVVEKMASLGKLAAVMAHEINNPLAGIATYAKLMRRKAEGGEPGSIGGDPESAKILELIESEAQRCGNIVRNLLLFSRQPGARFAEETLKPLIDRCVLLVHHQAELQEVEIKSEVEDDLPLVECDASQIQQVVLALIMNALEAMPGGGALTVRAEPGAATASVVLQVKDTGVGIKPEDLARIFEPFHTTKEQGEGVGLGLSVVYGIVQRHHGRIHIDSKVGEGTTFTVRLPTKQPESVEGSQEVVIA